MARDAALRGWPVSHTSTRRRHAAEHQRRAEPGGAGADNDHVVHAIIVT